MTPQTLYSGAAVLGAAALGLGAVFVAGANSDPFEVCRPADQMIDVAQVGAPFALTDETGARVTDADIVTGPTLVYFGYTFCPDVCPMDNARNAEAAYLVEEAGDGTIATVFVSIDPRRDTPEQLARFTDLFHPDMVGLTGTPDEVAAVAEAYHAYYAPQDPLDDDDAFYLVDHSTFTYLMMPGEGVVDVIGRDVPADAVVDRAACVAEVAAAG
ncbi:MAG: SCO family protein [Pseudomonadota bacterium]